MILSSVLLSTILLLAPVNAVNECTAVALKWQEINPGYRVDPLNSTACCTIPGVKCVTNANNVTIVTQIHWSGKGLTGGLLFLNSLKNMEIL